MSDVVENAAVEEVVGNAVEATQEVVETKPVTNVCGLDSEANLPETTPADAETTPADAETTEATEATEATKATEATEPQTEVTPTL